MASGNYTYEFNMKEVPEGSYNVVINAQDTFNNTGNLLIKQLSLIIQHHL